MKRALVLLFFVPVFCFAVGAVGETAGAKRALDLPAGGPGTGEDDEDAPETIHFYGSEYEGEAFFWCFHAFNF